MEYIYISHNKQGEWLLIDKHKLSSKDEVKRDKDALWSHLFLVLSEEFDRSPYEAASAAHVCSRVICECGAWEYGALNGNDLTFVFSVNGDVHLNSGEWIDLLSPNLDARVSDHIFMYTDKEKVALLRYETRELNAVDQIYLGLRVVLDSLQMSMRTSTGCQSSMVTHRAAKFMCSALDYSGVHIGASGLVFTEYDGDFVVRGISKHKIRIA